MTTLADVAAQTENPNLEQQAREWQEQRRAAGEEPNDWAAFRRHLEQLGAPDPGEDEPEDFAAGA